MLKKINSKRIAALHPSAFLLFVQIFSLFLYAGFEEVTSGRTIISVVGVLVLVLAVWVVNRSPADNWVAWTFAILTFVLSVSAELSANTFVLFSASIVEAILYFYVASSLIAYMMGDSSVTTDEMFAAAATFTVLAWAFAYLYLACQVIFPDSFINAAYQTKPNTFLELLFLSFASLSATGLSDILPITSYARVLV